MLHKPPFLEKLTTALDEIEDAAFADGGLFPYRVHPSLTVANLGPITLPLQPQAAFQLLRTSRLAPFGRGPATVIDTSVRNCRQIDATEIGLSEEWHSAVQDLAMCVGNTLGVSGTVSANLYKLVLYQPGGFFKSHRDTEKEPGMFGTLVIQLPSWHQGGALVVRKGVEQRYDWSRESQNRYHYAAFFADCEHELERVNAGYRLVLLYNMVSSSRGREDPFMDSEIRIGNDWKGIRAFLSDAADEWSKWQGAPNKAALVMEHQYTMGNAAFGMLKGRDRAIVEALQSSGKFRLHLALIEKKKTGSADEDYWNRDPYEERDTDTEHEDDDDDSEREDPNAGYCDVSGGAKMIEHIDTKFKVIEWIDETDAAVDLGGLELDMDNDIIDGDDPFENCSSPDDEEYEATGNEGATVEYIYHRAVLVMWPRTKKDVILCSMNITGAIRKVLRLIQSEQKHEANLLLENILKCAAEGKKRVAHKLPDLLKAACVLQNKKAVHAILALQAQPSEELRGESSWRYSLPKVNCGCCSEKWVTPLVDVIKRLEWGEVHTMIMELVRKTPPYRAHHCAQLALTLLDLAAFSNAAEIIGVSAVDVACHGTLCDESATIIIPMMFRIPRCLNRMDIILAAASRVSPRAISGLVTQIASRQVALTEQNFKLSFEKIVRFYISKAFTSNRRALVIEDDTRFSPVFAALLELRWECDELLEVLTSALLGSGSTNQLRATLQNPKVAQAAGNKFVARVMEARLSQLSYPKPVYTHCRSEAEIPNHPEVTAFLRNDEERMVYRAFGGIKEARGFACQYFSDAYYPTDDTRNYSAEAKADGRGRDSYVEIRKTRAAHHAKIQQFERDQEELARIRALIAGKCDTAVPIHKRRRTNVLIVRSQASEIIDLTTE